MGDFTKFSKGDVVLWGTGHGVVCAVSPESIEVWWDDHGCSSRYTIAAVADRMSHIAHLGLIERTRRAYALSRLEGGE